jgi:hypothetical protein
MARSAWATMTRGRASGFNWSSDEPRVDARVKDLREMAIGRTDDPEIPLKPVALEVARLFGTGSRTPSGPAVMAPRRQGRAHDRSRTTVKISSKFLNPRGRGPPVHTWFHLAMRVQHVARAAKSWPDPRSRIARLVPALTETIERIRWRLWHGQVRRALDLLGETIAIVDAPADDTAAARKGRASWAIWRHTCQDNPLSSSTMRQRADAKNRFRRRSPRARCR